MNTFIILSLMIVASSCSSGHFSRERITESSSFKICLIGDTGTGSNDQKELASHLLNENCSSIYFLGDIIYPEGVKNANDNQIKSRFVDVYIPNENTTNPKLNILLGNHDYRGNPDVWLEISKIHNQVNAPARYYSQDFGEVCITAIDTNTTGEKKYFIKYLGQVKWLRGLKKELSHCRIKIALGHHPYISSGKHHGDAKGSVKDFLSNHILKNYNFYVSGHEHILSYEGKHKGTELFISGAGGNPDKGYNSGFITMEFEKTGNQIEVLTTLKRLENRKLLSQEFRHSF